MIHPSSNDKSAAPGPQPLVSPDPGGSGGGPVAPKPGESARACEAFRIYLELGPKRRYAAVARKLGASLRTVKRWASAFDWRGRIKLHSAQLAEHYAETETAIHREGLLDAAARARSFRDRQYSLAEALLDAAERYLENMDPDDPDQMSFSEACKALEIASRLGQHAASAADDSTTANGRALTDHLSALLDQAYCEATTPQNGVAAPTQANP